MSDQGDGGGRRSSARGEATWKAAREDMAARNAQARKAGKERREAYDQRRIEARRAEEARRHATLLGKRTGRSPKG